MGPSVKVPSTTRRSYATSFLPKGTSVEIFKTVYHVCFGYYYRFLSFSYISWLPTLSEAPWGRWWGGLRVALDPVPIREGLGPSSRDRCAAAGLNAKELLLSVLMQVQASFCAAKVGTPISTGRWGGGKQALKEEIYFFNHVLKFW